MQASDLRAVAQLATQATTSLVNMADGVHRSVLTTLRLPCSLTGLVYRAARGLTSLVGQGADNLLSVIQPLLESAERAPAGSPQREAILAALNGVMGDHLAATGNPLATPMSLRHAGQTLDLSALPSELKAGGKVLLLVHGLCMNDLQWHTRHRGQPAHQGLALASSLGYVPIYARYNSGLHISQNGRQLSDHLEALLKSCPDGLEEVSVLAHSMGGLVIRSAVHYAQQSGLEWPQRLKSIVFLGTPHHGAPLERAGNWFHQLLGRTPFTAPFSQLGRLRSAGITDVRYGNLVDEDWHGHDRFHPRPDQRQVLRLPEGVACYAVAGKMRVHWGLGDGLVPSHSALGLHPDPQRNLHFPEGSQVIFERTNHMQLLSSPEVARQLELWLRQS